MELEQRLRSLEAKLARLEDIDAIKQLKARYLNACDQQDPEEVRRCFARGEVIIDMAAFGYCENRDQFVDGIFVPRGCHEYVLDMHHCANPEIELLPGGDRATGLWSLNYRNIKTREQSLTLLSALYHDEYAKEDGEWKVSRSRTEYRTVMRCSYVEGSLQLATAGREMALP